MNSSPKNSTVILYTIIIVILYAFILWCLSLYNRPGKTRLVSNKQEINNVIGHNNKKLALNTLAANIKWY